MYISAYLCPVRAEIFNQTSHPKTGQSGSKPVTWQPYQHIWLQLVSFTVQNESLCCVPSQPVTTDSDPVMLVSLVLHQCQCFSEVAISVDFSSALQFCGSCIVLVIRPRVLISAGLLHCDQPASHYSSFGRMFWWMFGWFVLTRDRPDHTVSFWTSLTQNGEQMTQFKTAVLVK